MTTEQPKPGRKRRSSTFKLTDDKYLDSNIKEVQVSDGSIEKPIVAAPAIDDAPPSEQQTNTAVTTEKPEKPETDAPKIAAQKADKPAPAQVEKALQETKLKMAPASTQRRNAVVDLVLLSEDEEALNQLNEAYSGLGVTQVLRSITNKLHGQVRKAVASGDLKSLPARSQSDIANSVRNVTITANLIDADFEAIRHIVDPLALLSNREIIRNAYNRVLASEMQRLRDTLS